MEDFAQLAGRTRDTKYDSSMEQVAGVIDAFATFPAVEKAKLFARFLFCFVYGETRTMHLKNWSLITRGRRVELAPAYDLLNTSIVLRNPEETALPVNGKRKSTDQVRPCGLLRREWLGLSDRTIDNVLVRLAAAQDRWQALIGKSFLSEDMKRRYREVVTERVGRIAG
ncbi:MAG: HipA domain-containing protein [Spirochaetota bacterium]